MNKNHFCLLLMVSLSVFIGNLLGQDTLNQRHIFPEGISLEYGIGSYAVTDEYISKEKYSGSHPSYSITWANQHSNYVYHLKIDFGRYDGLPWEWLGIPPDIRVEQTETDILAGRDKQLEYAIEMLK